MKLTTKLALLISITLFSGSSLFATHMSKEKINARTAPVAKVTTAEMAAKKAAAEKAAMPVRTGESIYGSLCISCHGTGVANAPIAHNTTEWEKRLAVGIDGLVASAKQGKNAMPPMGTCADCSDEDLKNAIEFMASAKN